MTALALTLQAPAVAEAAGLGQPHGAADQPQEHGRRAARPRRVLVVVQRPHLGAADLALVDIDPPDHVGAVVDAAGRHGAAPARGPHGVEVAGRERRLARERLVDRVGLVPGGEVAHVRVAGAQQPEAVLVARHLGDETVPAALPVAVEADQRPEALGPDGRDPLVGPRGPVRVLVPIPRDREPRCLELRQLAHRRVVVGAGVLIADTDEHAALSGRRDEQDADEQECGNENPAHWLPISLATTLPALYLRGIGAPCSDSGRGPKMRRSASSIGTSLMLASRRRM